MTCGPSGPCGADGPPLKAETGAETWLFCLGCPK